MPLNTEFPTWMAQQTRDDTAAGIAIGRNLLEGFRLQQEKARYESEAPIRAAQLEAYKAQTQGNVNRANAEAFAWQQKQKQVGSIADAMALESDIAGSENGYSNPGNRARFYAFLKGKPELIETDWAKGMDRKFELSDAMALKEQKLLNDIAIAESRATSAEELYKLRAADTEKNLQTRLDANEKLSQQKIDATLDVLKTKEEKAEIASQPRRVLLERGLTNEQIDAAYADDPKGYQRSHQAMRYADKQAQTLKKAFDYDFTEADEDAAQARFLSGQAAINAPANIVKDTLSEAQSFKMLNDAIVKVESFNKRYGDRAFEKYVGPIDNPVFNVKSLAVSPEDLPKADAEARSVFRDVGYIIQQYRKANFGTALTENETKEFKKIIADPKFADYFNSIKTFRDNVKKAVDFKVGAYRFSENIPLDIRGEFFFKKQGSSPQGTTTPRTNNVRVLSIEPIPEPVP